MLKINDLMVKVNDKKVLNEFALQINDGEVHVIMGKNGTGKSTLCKVLLHDPSYMVDGGTINFNGQNLLALATHEIAQKGLMLISQNPVAIEGVTNAELLRTALNEIKKEKINIFEFNKKLEDECDKLALDHRFIHKEVNVGASGGERKKIELLHMGILEPKFIILDEIDSGLDVDALKVVCNYINEYQKMHKASLLIITHHPRILDYLNTTYVHILSEGKIVKTGNKSLAFDIEKYGFDGTNAISESENNEYTINE